MYQALYVLFYNIIGIIFFGDTRSARAESGLQNASQILAALGYGIVVIIAILGIYKIVNELRAISYNMNIKKGD